MRYYNYLNENRSQQIDENTFNSLLNNNCNQIMKLYNKGVPMIYRGTHNNNDFVFIDPTKFNRTSANTYNFYTIMFDEVLPSWKNMPKRSKSIICSSSNMMASMYGDSFEVYPYDNNKIGICPKDDIWNSFDIFSMDMFNEYLLSLSGNFNIKLTADKNTFISFCNEIDGITKKDLLNFSKSVDSSLHLFINQYLTSKKSFLSFLNIFFNPKNNGFSVKKSSTYKTKENVEIWIEGPCLMKRKD